MSESTARIWANVAVPRHLRMELLRALDKLGYCLGMEQEGAPAPAEYRIRYVIDVIGLYLEKTELAEKWLPSYQPSMWLSEKEKEHAKLGT